MASPLDGWQLHSSGGLTGFAVGHCPRSAREATKIASIRSIPRTLCGQAANIVDRQGLVVTPEFLPAEGGAFGGLHTIGWELGFKRRSAPQLQHHLQVLCARKILYVRGFEAT